MILLSDNRSLSFYDEVIMKYGVLKPMLIEEATLKEMIRFNECIKAYKEALKYINVRLRTKKEIRIKLKEYDKTTIEYVINRLSKNGYLNNSLYINSYVNDAINLSLKGPLKIKKELENLEFTSVEIETVLEKIEDIIWIDRIKKIMGKKINANNKYSKMMLENKIKEYLYNLGYNKEMIENCFNSIEIQDDDCVIQKEYEKSLKKLERKYEGWELKQKIKTTLYRKGFSLSDIEKIMSKD